MRAVSATKAESGYDFLCEKVRLYTAGDWINSKSQKVRCDECREMRHTSEFDCFHQDTPAAYQYWRRTTCQTCRSKIVREWRSSPLRTQGIDDHLKRMVSGAKAGARTRGIAFTLDTDDLLGLYVQQGGACAVSGLPFRFEAGTGARDKRGWWRPSLDRINSNGNYAVGNVHLVAQAINLMKFDLPMGLFLDLCERITERRLTGAI